MAFKASWKDFLHRLELTESSAELQLRSCALRQQVELLEAELQGAQLRKSLDVSYINLKR